MKKLLDQIIEATYKANSFYDEDAIKPKANAPASAADLQRLDKHLKSKGCVAPPSYRTFLSIYNGIENLLGESYSLLSVDEIVGRKYELLKSNVKEFPNLCEFVIAAGDTPNFMGFDTHTSAKGNGYELAEISSAGKEWRLKSFDDFLSALLANLQKTIQGEEKDRRKLKR